MKPRKRQASGRYTHDGIEMTWELVREAHYSSFEGYKGMTFSVRAVSETARTFKELILEFPFPERKPGKPVEKERIYPATIEAAIRQAIGGGFDPTSRGRVYVWQVEPFA
ncbi:MAG: hypothetical protein JO167_09295 [Alphaproteobacteria bacterium]|nr:hypothetical protein [Alphaproteobacteria bacterium]MBV9541452.1 hypothetical protein [Alphaproteobacteria bacterium]MBV9904477.1 hypothetical protein [Alphaproteobacteria bacterium]